MRADTPMTTLDPEEEDVEFLGMYRAFEDIPSDPDVNAVELHRFLAIRQELLP
jgi:hypothetical protein